MEVIISYSIGNVSGIRRNRNAFIEYPFLKSKIEVRRNGNTPTKADTIGNAIYMGIPIAIKGTEINDTKA